MIWVKESGSDITFRPGAAGLQTQGMWLSQDRGLESNMTSQSDMQSAIDELLLSGSASTMAEAESMFLDAHLVEIAGLAERLTEEEFGSNELVRLLLAHGSRPWEDSLL